MALVVVAAACHGPSVGSSSSGIVNGTEAEHDEMLWTVAVASRGGNLCTGTLISDYAVLTAKHCVFEEQADGTFVAAPPSRVRVVVGQNLQEASGVIESMGAYEIRTTPGVWTDRALGDGEDIAVVLLPRKFGGNIEPRGFATSPPSRGGARDGRRLWHLQPKNRRGRNEALGHDADSPSGLA